MTSARGLAARFCSNSRTPSLVFDIAPQLGAAAASLIEPPQTYATNGTPRIDVSSATTLDSCRADHHYPAALPTLLTTTLL
jgi:hypothetical protein